MQQHRQHFNLSEAAKHMLDTLAAHRFPGRQRRQSQLIEDLIVEAFSREVAADSSPLKVLSDTSSIAYRASRTTLEHPSTSAERFLAEQRAEYSAAQEDLCYACNSQVHSDWLYCVFCGSSLVLVCPHCSAPRLNIEAVKYCFSCGGLLD